LQLATATAAAAAAAAVSAAQAALGVRPSATRLPDAVVTN